MKTTIYWVRHAQAAGNLNGTYQGSSDEPLSGLGQDQLSHLARRFVGVPLDAVYSSPLMRAQKTAEAVNQAHGLPIHIEPRLREINGGGFEGLTWDKLMAQYPAAYAQWCNQPHLFEAPAGDRMVDVLERVCAAATDILRENAGKSVAIATHGGVLRNYFCFARGWPHNRLIDVNWVDNTGVCVVTYDDNFLPTVVFENDTSHLPPALVTPKTRRDMRQAPATRAE